VKTGALDDLVMEVASDSEGWDPDRLLGSLQVFISL
jgi:hypothetical protein